MELERERETECGEQVPELGHVDLSVAVLVEVAETLDELLHRVRRLVLVHRLVYGQELLERQPRLCNSTQRPSNDIGGREGK